MSEYITYKNTFQDKPEKLSQYCEYIRAFRKKEKKKTEMGVKKKVGCVVIASQRDQFAILQAT